MCKKFFVGFCVVVSFLTINASVYAEENGMDKENEARKVRVYRLENMQAALNQYVQEITADEKATAKEMRGLIERVKEITQARKEAIAIYGQASMMPEADERLAKIADLYTEPLLRHGARNQEKIKLLLMQVSGKDVTAVEEDFQTSALGLLLFLLIIGCLMVTAGAGWDIEVIFVGGVVFLLMLFILLVAGLAGV